ncbi:MAG: ice-binding family protein [Gammaproteobacteria bacterium]
MELAARGGRDSQGNYDVHRAAQLSDANDAWILQIAQNLTAGNGAIVTLSGGAQAKYIFWQVAGQATLGTTSDFKGSILSKILISFNTGAAITGEDWHKPRLPSMPRLFLIRS